MNKSEVVVKTKTFYFTQGDGTYREVRASILLQRAKGLFIIYLQNELVADLGLEESYVSAATMQKVETLFAEMQTKYKDFIEKSKKVKIILITCSAAYRTEDDSNTTDAFDEDSHLRISYEVMYGIRDIEKKSWYCYRELHGGHRQETVEDDGDMSKDKIIVLWTKEREEFISRFDKEFNGFIKKLFEFFTGIKSDEKKLDTFFGMGFMLEESNGKRKR
jgi:hypothetical protein